jgi:cytochrome c peroxidase
MGFELRGALSLSALLAVSLNAFAITSEDLILRKAIEAYQIRAPAPVEPRLGSKERLGQALFFDPVLSGPKNIACATCHIRSKGAGDGIPLSVGLGAEGVGKDRLNSTDAFVIPRNALALYNRGSVEFTEYFWDGRVQLGPQGQFESPLGARLPPGFANLLAVASVFPLAEPDEMLGRIRRGADGKKYHSELVNNQGNTDNYQERTTEVFGNLITRLLGPTEGASTPTTLGYRKLFADAYPEVKRNDINISHVGNALAAYIAAAFELKASPWDSYVNGDYAAITPVQKQGAILFFGKGRCVVCHSGYQFSDFQFHGLAIPQLRIGKHVRHIDYGRGAATSSGSDRFTFRTPPLRNVARTGPWGHNGIFESIDAAISHHINPIPLLYQAQRGDPDEAALAGRLLGFRSRLLAEISPLSEMEVNQLAEFLNTLSSETLMPDGVAVPTSVPSGRNEFIVQNRQN